MVSRETEAKLAKIFITLAKGERKAEISRQVLCDNPDFNSLQLFKLIDKENKNYIDSTSIINFLTANGILINDYEAKLLILFYDRNYDGVLSFNEFIFLIKDQNTPQELLNNNNSSNMPISFNINYSFIKLFEKEIELARKILLLLNEIKNDKNFDIHELYHKVKISNFINEDGIKNFLDKNNEYFLDSDIYAILKRLDINKDGKVDLCEFHAFLGFPKCYYCCPCMECNHCGTCYCNMCFCECHCNYHKRTHRSYNSPSKYNKNRNDLERNNMDYEMNLNQNNDIINKNPNLENNLNTNRTYNNYNYNIDNNIQDNNNYNYNLERNNYNKYNNNYNGDDEINYNNNNYKGFGMKTKDILENNNDYNDYYNNNSTEIRQPYANKDLMLNDSSLNAKNNGEIKKISKSLNIRPSPERKHRKKEYNIDHINEYSKLNNNYNTKNDNTFNNLRSYNLFEQDEYEQNQNYNENDIKVYNQNEYEENQFNEFLRQIMVAEGQIERIKVNLALRPDFNCEDCFRIFELDGKGKLYPEDIKEGLNLIGVFYSDFEIDLFFKRFDLKNKGYIDYSDFFDIFVPFQREYRNIVEERKPNSCCPCRCPDIFCPETLSILKNLMDNIIKHENNFNFLRRGFTTLNLKLKHIFENIDILKMGYFTNSDLIVYLKKNKIFSDNLDADLLFIRLDRNRNGKIDYHEIYDETHPLYNLN